LSRAYYNEHDPYAASWLRNLIDAGHLPEGDVDGRCITEVRPGDLRGYSQCHFFAGVGGWPLALRMAGVPDSRELWTGSCPCQSFSDAGAKRGFADERHLWPSWMRLIRKCRPPVVLGEQVEKAIPKGWLDLVFRDLESEGYACGSAVLGAHSVGAPHIRQRLYWVADSNRIQHDTDSGRTCGEERGTDEAHVAAGNAAPGGGAAYGLGDSDSGRQVVGELEAEAPARRPRPVCGVGDAEHDGPPAIGELRGEESEGRVLELERPSGGMGDSHGGGQVVGELEVEGPIGRPRTGGGYWDGCEWIPCRDGKSRPIEPGIEPLVDGLPSGVGRLRAYGNAIVPSLAAEFIKACLQ
jgi:DNA (cytosine-5)-methyltransferase 1